MELLIRNLGRIAEASLTIKPLTVFVGPNGTNKTWTAYALYTLAQAASQDFFRGDSSGVNVDARIKRKISDLVISTMDKLEKAKQGASSAAFAISVERSELLEDSSDAAELWMTPHALARCLQIHPVHFRGARVTLQISSDDLRRTNVAGISLLFGKENIFEVSFRSERDNRNVQVFRASGSTEEVRQILPSLLRSMAIGTYQTVVALPAERKSLLSMSDALTPDFVKLVARPASDFVELMRRFKFQSKYKFPRERNLVGRNAAEKFLEGSLFGGMVEFQESDESLTLKIKDLPPLAIHSSSSMTRSLAGLDRYLKSFAKQGDLLIIDEPEMNAHPDAQLKIVEFISLIVNLGIHVVMTTHSPYVADHLNNLIAASRRPFTKKAAFLREFALGNSQAFIDPERIAVYLFEESGKVKNIFDPKSGLIDVTTFADATNKIGGIYSRLTEDD